MPKIKSKRRTAAKKKPPVPSTNPEQVESRQLHRTIALIIKQDPIQIGLSDLPGEIRTRIYEFALTSPSVRSLRLDRRSNLGRKLGTGLFRTCKAIEQESRAIFYQDNVFRVDMLPLEPRKDDPQHPYWANDNTHQALRRFLDARGPEVIAMMSSFCFVYHFDLSLHRFAHQHILKQGDIAIRVDSLRDAPYFRVSLDIEAGKMRQDLPGEQCISGALAIVRDYLAAYDPCRLDKQRLMNLVRHLRVWFKPFVSP